MDKMKFNRIYSVALMVLGVLTILVALFSDSIPHEWHMVLSIVEILLGCGIIAGGILKIRGKF